jgi:hypothetical protein
MSIPAGDSERLRDSLACVREVPPLFSRHLRYARGVKVMCPVRQAPFE